ncbi:MAG TPA: PAS domain S-box protein [Thermoanaerobaculia bacterium]|nr:PAS domain S-box protein [Thermoanaerobaculia bacterium]
MSASRDLARVLSILFIGVAAEIVLLFFFYLPTRRTEALRRTRSQLSFIANDRANAVEAWARERRSDATLAAAYIAEVTRNRPADSVLSPEAHELLQKFVLTYQYDAAYVVDASGRIVATSARASLDEPCITEFARRALAQQQPIVDFCLNRRHQPKVLSAATFPLQLAGGVSQTAAVVFAIDPYPYLYPAIAKWTFVTETGETTIARTEGANAIALAPLRHHRGRPMTFYSPVESTAIGAARRQGNSVRYQDYRGHDTLGELRQLTSTPWYLVIKIDEEEALAPAVAETVRFGSVLALALLVVGAIAFALLRSRRVREMRSAEDNFRRLFENAMSGILVFDVIVDRSGRPVDHRLIGANPASERLTGIRAEEEIGRRQKELSIGWPPELVAQFHEVAMTGKAVQYERFDQSLGRWFETRVFAPRPGEFALMFNDITERKDAERTIRALADDSLLGVFSYENEVITYINRAGAAMFGYEREEVLGQHPAMIVHPDDQELVENQIRRRMSGDIGGETYVFRGRRRDESPCWIEASVNPIIRDGRVKVIGNLIDVTERVNAESALRRLAIAVAQLAEGIVIMDPSGVIQYTNPAFEQLTGFSHAETIGKEWPLADTDDPVYAEIWATIREGALWQGCLTRTRWDQTKFDEDVTISPVRDDAGRIVNYVAIERDVSKERNLFAQLLQAQKMEAVGTLAGGVAHDFNNFLQGMTMMVQIATRRISAPEKLAQTLAELGRLVQRASSLTKQLLLFSRKDVAHPERIDLNTIIRDAARLLRRLVRENVAFEMHLAYEPLPVTVDRGQMEQVLVNLIVNASDAMPGGGRLRLQTGSDDGVCWVTVEDTGYGIPHAIRERVFEPFFTTKEKEKGTGLGLSVVHAIVTEHSGTVTFEDVTGGGTRFLITLPYAQNGEEAEQLAAGEESLPKGNGERVLVIEDEESVRAGLGAMLELLDYQPVLVGTAAAALLLPQDAAFDVLLSDVVLPDKPGPEVARELAERWPRLRIILMSGYTSDRELRKKAAAGEVTILDKPFAMAELANALRAAFDAPRT